MPFYAVYLDGSRIRFPSGDNELRGFVAGRPIFAASEEEAIEAATILILEQWHQDGFKELNNGQDPILELYYIRRRSLWEVMFGRMPRKGYTFYTEVDPEDDSN